MIFDHRHRGNLHIKAWLLAGPWAMQQEAVVPERQACIGTYHEPYQEACQGRLEDVKESLVAGQHRLVRPAKALASVARIPEDANSTVRPEVSPSLTATTGSCRLGRPLTCLKPSAVSELSQAATSVRLLAARQGQPLLQP